MIGITIIDPVTRQHKTIGIQPSSIIDAKTQGVITILTYSTGNSVVTVEVPDTLTNVIATIPN